MILADTSVWIEFLAKGDSFFSEQLLEGTIVTHPFIMEELACGTLRNRGEIFGLMGTLQGTPQASHSEFLTFVDHHRLSGSGLGAMDIHLLMSAKLAHASLYTHDKPLQRASTRLGLSPK